MFSVLNQETLLEALQLRWRSFTHLLFRFRAFAVLPVWG